MFLSFRNLPASTSVAFRSANGRSFTQRVRIIGDRPKGDKKCPIVTSFGNSRMQAAAILRSRARAKPTITAAHQQGVCNERCEKSDSWRRDVPFYYGALD